MNCRAAHRLLSAERDGALAPRERADLDAHLAECGSCRRARANLAAAIADWQKTTAAIAVPDVERAWQDIARKIRTGETVTGERPKWGFPRWAIPVGAAAALAVAAVTASRWFGAAPTPDAPVATVARLETARADYVEVPSNSSSMVYVDDKSGWLVVWAVNDKDKM